jgi:leucyl-tRNA synthetase
METVEPFAGLMTQGMVVHETFRDADGQWLYPEEVEQAGGARRRRSDHAPVTVGRMEKMSKSRKNVVGLERVVETYGADTARLLLLSDSPPERDLEWSDAGIEGAWRYVGRLWRLVHEPAAPLPPSGTQPPSAVSPAADRLRRSLHRTIAAVGGDLDAFRFNRAVARVRELTNAIAELPGSGEGEPAVLREALDTLVIMIGPMMPHLAEELWRALGHQSLVAEESWPSFDPVLAVDEEVTLAVQVNGKLRATITLPRDADRAAAETAALAEPAVGRALEGRSVRKVVVVPNRIVNVVA